jgi:hypothetical protein
VPNTINPRPLETALSDLKNAGMSDSTIRLFRDTFTRIDKALTNLGQLQSQVPITGRPEPIGTTVSKVNSSGNLLSTDNIAADGTGSPLTGGKRGFVALDTNNRLAGSFRANAVNIAGTPTSSTGLSNDGISTAITVTATAQQFGDGTVNYNSGSVDPGVFGGPFYIFADDPTFAGGAVTYQFSTTPQNQTSTNGRVQFGSITTVNGSAKTGGGSTGGTGGRAGGRGYVQ